MMTSKIWLTLISLFFSSKNIVKNSKVDTLFVFLTFLVFLEYSQKKNASILLILGSFLILVLILSSLIRVRFLKIPYLKFLFTFLEIISNFLFLFAISKSSVVIETETNINRDQKYFEGLKISLYEIIFLLRFHNHIIKFLSLIYFSLIVTLMGDFIKPSDLMIIILLNIYFAFCILNGNSWNFLNRMKQSRKKKNFLTTKIKNVHCLDNIFRNIHDIMFLFDQKKRLIYKTNNFIDCSGDFLDSIFFHSSFSLYKIECNEDDLRSSYYEFILNKDKYCEENSTETNTCKKYNLEEILNFNLKKKNKKLAVFFLMGKVLKENNDFVIVTLSHNLISLTIKRDPCFQEHRRSQIRMENHSKIVSFVSHEFRTPLNCVINMLEHISADNSPHLQEYIQPAIISSKFLLNLVNDLLDTAQIEAGTFKLIPHEFDLNELIEDSAQIIFLQASGRGLKILINHDPKIKGLTLSDGNRIRQILINLLSNALKYTTEGSITVSSQMISHSDIKISIADTGLGIKDEDQNKLFKAFGRIVDQKNIILNSQGIGLGLLICDKLSRQLNNHLEGIQFESSYGKGSIFSFKFTNLINSDQENTSMESECMINKIDNQEYKMIEFLKIPRNLNAEEEECEKKRRSFPKKTLYTIDVPNNNTRFPIVNTRKTNGEFDSEKSIKQTRSSLLRDNSNSIRQRTKTISDFHFSEKSLEDKVEAFKNRIIIRECKCPLALIIDDNDFNILVLKNHLNKLNIDCKGVLSADDALKEIKNLFKKGCCKFFKLIFIDLEMPFKNGVQAFIEIIDFYDKNKIEEEIISFAVTGYNSENELVKKIKESGVKDILIKPFSFDILFKKIDIFF